MRRTHGLGACFALYSLLLVAPRAAADAPRPVQLIVQRTAASATLLDALRAAIDDAEVEVALQEAPLCEAAPGDALRVVVRWQRGEPIEVCFVRGSELRRRTLEAAAELDAPAREQLVTLVEAGVAALRSGVSGEGASAPRRTGSERAEDRASGGAAWLSVEHSDAPARAADVDTVALPGPPRVWQLALGYAGDWIAAGPLHGLAALGGVSLSPAWSVTLQLGFGPWSERTRDGVGVQLSSLQLRAAVTGALELSPLVSLELRAGPALERLSMRSNAATGARLPEGSTPTAHLDLLLSAQLGSRVRLGGTFWLAVWLGADFALTQRQVGFSRADGAFVGVAEASHVRPRLDAQLGIFL